MAAERIQKALARAGVASRRKIEELVHRGRVTINGEVAQVGDKVDLEVDHVKVDGKRVQPLRRPQLYLVLNKPPGYVSTVNDPQNRLTVLDLLPERMHKALFPVGRLDYDSEGLLLMTTDGEFAQKVAHPSSGCTKLYEVKVKGQPDGPALAKLSRGITLDGRHAAPAWVESFSGPPGRRTGRDNSWYRVALKEGRTRQIREMFFRIGHPVMRLKRTQIGGFTDPFLRSGAWRELEPAEIEKLLTGEPARRPAKASRGRMKVKFEGLIDAETGEVLQPKPAKPPKPVRRRITAPLEEGAPPPTRRKPLPSPGARRTRPPGGAEDAASARPRRGALGERDSFVRPRRERPAPEEWGTAKPARPDEAEWTSTPPARQPQKSLFEESEFESRPASFLYGDDDESWDEPLDAPRPAAPGGGRSGRPPAGGRGERTSRPARAGALAGWNAGEGGRARRPAGGDERPPRVGRGRTGRPSGYGDDRPGRPPRAGFGPGGPRPPAFGEDRPGRPARPSGRPAARPSRPRNGAGRNTPPAGRPGGGFDAFSEDFPPRGPRGAGRPGGRPGAGRPGAGRPGGASGEGPARPARPRGEFRPGGERPSGGRPGAGRPSAGRPSAGRPAGGRPGADRPGGGRPGGGRPGGERPGGGRPGGGRPGGGKPRGGGRG